MSKKKILGKSMDALFDNQGKLPSTMKTVHESEESIRSLAIDLITSSVHQPREHFDQQSIESLAESIKSEGIIQPIVVVKEQGKNIFNIIAGERRWRAAKLAGLKRVPAIVRTLAKEQASIIALIENIQREDLNPLERAKAIESLALEHQVKQQELAQRLGVSRTYLTNTLRLLKLSTLPQEALLKGAISEGHAKILCALSAHEQKKFLGLILKQKLSVRALEEVLENYKKSQSDVSSIQVNQKNKSALKPVEDFFEDFFGMRVHIKEKGNHKGQVILHYNSHEELEAMIDKLGTDVENRF